MCAETASHESGSRSDRKAMPMTLPGGGLSGYCCGGSLDDESTIRVAWVHSRGRATSQSVSVYRLFVFSRVVLLLIASRRECFGTSGHPFPLTFVHDTV